MKRSLMTRTLGLVGLAVVVLTGPAYATCTINGTGMSLSPVTGSTGTYTSPTAPTAQALTLLVSGTYTTNAAAGTCTLAVTFQRTSYPPATMSNSAGSTLPYTIQTAAGGGTTLIYSGTTSTNFTTYAFAGVANKTNAAFTASLTIYLLMQPGTPQPSGSYLDTLSFEAYNYGGCGSSCNPIYTTTFTVTGKVKGSCTIGGVATPAADTATIPVSAAGAVNTAVINKTYANALCSGPANLQLTSQNGAVMVATSPPSGFTNMINYTSTATFSGASASLNTATNPLATGAESGTAVSTTGVTPSGTLAVTITPQATSQPLVVGTYKDVLIITITPQ